MRRTRALMVVGTIACMLMVAGVLLPHQSIAEGASPTAAVRFPDVPSQHPYYTAISSMATLGFVSGYADGHFGPSELVTRQQFAKMAVLTLGIPVSESGFPNSAVPFEDLGNDDVSTLYPHEYVAVCAMNGITRGLDATHFGPLANITRAQAISMIVRAADNLASGALESVPADWSGALSYGDTTHGANIRSAEYNGLLAGIEGSAEGLATWNTAGNATRGEIAQMLCNLWNKFQATGVSPTTTTTTTSPTATTTTTAGTPPTIASKTHFGFGETANVNSLQITVERPLFDPTVDLYVNDVASSTKKPFLVKVSIVNASSGSKKYSRTDFVLVTASRDFYDSFGFSAPSVFTYNPLGKDQSLAAGASVTGYVAFVVPNAAVADHVNHLTSGKTDAIWED
jgi:hypothetical protein